MATGLQNIVDGCTSLRIDRRKVVGVQISRNEIPRTSLTPTKQPWRFSLEMPGNLAWYVARPICEALDTIDRYSPQLITFNNRTAMNWIWRYQGAMTTGQQAAVTVTSFTGNQLVLGNLPAVGASTVLFEPNDLIQIHTYPFPFTSTTQVLRGAGTTVTVTTHRPNILSGTVSAKNITIGSACQFYMVCTNMPTYTLVPGAFSGTLSSPINNARVEFSDNFQLMEWVGTS